MLPNDVARTPPPASAEISPRGAAPAPRLRVLERPLRLRRPRKSIVVILAVLGTVAALLMLAQDQETLRLRSAVPTESEGHLEYVAALVGADLTRGNAYEVLANGDEIFPAMLDAIRAARRRISFETYVYESGTVANQFTASLEDAARRGVQVTVVVDAIGASSMEDSHVERLRRAGARVEQFNPAKWYSMEHVNYRTHRKILVVDGEVGFTGGVGIADHWLGNAEDMNHWRDMQVRIQGPVVRLLEAAFYENLIDTGQMTTPIVDAQPARVDGEGASMIVRSSPTGGSSDLKRLYLLIIASARRTLDIASPYFVTDESTMWALEEASQRGVVIRVLVEGDITDAPPVKYASRAAYDRLLSMGVELYEYQPTMMHTKMLVADGILSMFGSANFDNRSLELNEELNIAVTNRNLASRLTTDFEGDLRRSKRLTLDAWRARPFPDKLREQLWAAFGEVF
jgi:cardiolipin synthase